MGNIKESWLLIVFFSFILPVRQFWQQIPKLALREKMFTACFICLRSLWEWVQSLLTHDFSVLRDAIVQGWCVWAKQHSLHARLRKFTSYIFGLGDGGITLGAWLKELRKLCLNSMFIISSPTPCQGFPPLCSCHPSSQGGFKIIAKPHTWAGRQ